MKVKNFMKKFSALVLGLGLTLGVVSTVNSNSAHEVDAADVTDVLTPSNCCSSTAYAAYTNISGPTSSAVYGGRFGYSSSDFTLNGSAGLFSVTSAGKVKSISIAWTSASKEAKIYGCTSSRTAYSDTTNATLLKTFSNSTNGKTDTYTFESDYEHFLIQTTKSSTKIGSFTIVWSSGTSGHTHSAGTSWENNSEKHWHLCADSQCPSPNDHIDEAAHTFVEDMSKHVDSTKTQKGHAYYECSVCGYKYDEELDLLTNDVLFTAGVEKGTKTAQDKTTTETISKNGVTISCTDSAMAAVSNNVYTYRFYKDSTLTISANEGTIIKIEFETDANNGMHSASSTVGTYTCANKDSNGIWEGEASSVSFTMSAQCRAKSIKICLDFGCGHENKVLHQAASATCTNAGNAAYYTCPDCDVILAADGITELEAIPVIAATGHSYLNGGVYTVTKEPTCIAAGSKERTCVTCGGKDIVSIPLDPTAHDLSFNTGEEATQEATGIKPHFVCELCGKKFWDSDALKEITVESDLITPMITHEHVAEGGWVEGEASHHHVCSDCGEQFDIEAHTYGEGVETPSTCTTQGKITYTCTKCGHVEEEILDLKAHTYGSVAKVDSTFEQTGVEAHYECSECHKLFTKISEQYIEVSAQDLVIPTKEHAFNGEYQHNDTEHWKMCSDAGYETLEGEHVNHTFVKNTELSEEATPDKEGMLVEKCVCGATRTSLINPLDKAGDFEIYTKALVEGDYIITQGGYYLGNTITSGRMDNGDEPTFTGDKITNANSSIIWHIAKNGDYWTLYNESVKKYLGGNGSKNQAALLDSITDYAKFTPKLADGLFDFENLGCGNRSSNSGNKWLRNNTNNGWAMYASATGDALTLYKSSIQSQVAIRYEDGEGNRVGASVGVPGTSLTMNDGSSLTKEGYYVSGWQDAEGNEVNLTKFPSESMIVYPVWSERTVEYTVKYQPNYSGATEYSTTVAENATHSVLDVTDTKLGYSRVGYTFAGWKDGAGTTVSVGASQKITADLTLTAQWEKINYKFTFTATGGECTNESQVFTIDDGSLVIPSFEGTAPAAKEFDCWTVAGVDKQPGETIAITSETPEETALVAKWRALDLTATYELDGGTNNDKNVTTFTVDDAAHTLYHPTKEGFVFTGWTIDGQPVSTIKKGTSENVTVTANWAEAVNKHYQLVESVEGVEDLSGEYLLVAQKGDKYYAFDSVLNDLDQSQNTEEVVVNEGMIVAPNAYAVQIEKLENGSYSIKTSNGVSVGQSGSSASVAVRASEYSITDEGIKTGDYFLKMNTNDVRFRFYKSGQTDVKLYKLVEYTEIAEEISTIENNVMELQGSTVEFENATVENGKAMVTASDNVLMTVKAEDGKTITGLNINLACDYTVSYKKVGAAEEDQYIKLCEIQSNELVKKSVKPGSVNGHNIELPEDVGEVIVTTQNTSPVELKALSVESAIDVATDLGFFYEGGSITRGQLHFDIDTKFIPADVAEYGFLMTTDLTKDPTTLGTWDIFMQDVDGFNKYEGINSLTLGTNNLSKEIKVVFYTIDNDENLVMSEVVVMSFDKLVMNYNEDLDLNLMKSGDYAEAQSIFTNYRTALLNAITE